MCFSPLSDKYLIASFPQELSSCPPLEPEEPNPIRELQESQSLSLLLIIPILVMAASNDPVGDTTLNPSMSQFGWSEDSFRRDFHLSLPILVSLYMLSARSEYNETACFSIDTHFVSSPTLIPRQMLLKGLLQ